jgi:signal peptidase I
MTPTLHDGDLAVVERHASYHRGDIIAYRVPAGEPGAGTQVIHRIVGGSGTTGFVTRGDHNHYADPLWHPKTADVIGEVWFHIPRGARPIAWLRSPTFLAVLVGICTLVFVAKPPKRVPQEHEGPHPISPSAHPEPEPRPNEPTRSRCRDDVACENGTP